MSISRIYSQRASQPPDNAQVSDGRWTVVCNFAGLINAGSAKTVTPVLSLGPEFRATPWGVGIRVGVGADPSNVQLGSSSVVQRSTQSGVIVYVPSQVGAASTLYTTSSDTGSQAGFTIQQQAAGTIELSKHNTATILVSAGAVVANRINVVAWSYDGTSGRAVVVVNNRLTTGTSARTFTHGTTLLGRYRLNDNANSQPTTILLFALSPLEASSAEVQRRALQPWAIFAPIERGIWVPAPVAAGPIALSATSTATAIGSAALSVGKPLAASASAAVTSSAALSAGKPLAATASAAVTTSADLGVGKPLAASATAAVTASADLTVGNDLSRPLAASASASVTASADLSVGKPLAASAAVSVSGIADLTTGAAPAVAGGYYDKPKKRRFVQMVGDKFVVFNSANEAIRSLEKEQPKKAKQKPDAKPEQKPEPEQVIPVNDIRATAKVYQAEVTLNSLFKQKDYSEILALYESLRQQQDDEEVEMLALML